MRLNGQKGLSLVELLVTMAILAIIGTAATPLLSSHIQANSDATATSQLYREGLMAMERMTEGVRRCTFLVIPNDKTRTRDILAFSGTINDDGDYYFNDPLFPRIDEDTPDDANNDGQNGIAGIDDDGDGSIDELSVTMSGQDDDEGGVATSEDPLDGEDNDADGNIDEDFGNDMNQDGKPGIAGMDDDGDGLVDEDHLAQAGMGLPEDDDEDGVTTEEDGLNETIFIYNSGANTLTESIPHTGDSVVLSTHVTQFEAKYYNDPVKIRIQLRLQGDDGQSVQFSEHVCLRNVKQKIGKRVR
jgi:prepilin-type N-terminal cleavage/methylation domain-containing protein